MPQDDTNGRRERRLTAAEAPLPAGVGEAAVAAGVDISAALKRLGGNRGLYRRMLGTFVKELAAMPEQVAAHAAQGETQAASRLLHTVKGQAGTLGAMALSAEVAHGEKRFAEGHAGGDAELLVQQVSVAVTGAGPRLAALLQALQALQAAEAPVAAPGAVLDSDAVLKLLRTIGQHLQNADMAATDGMAELQRQYGGALGEQLQSLDEAISALDFDRALHLCNALINEMTEGQADAERGDQACAAEWRYPWCTTLYPNVSSWYGSHLGQPAARRIDRGRLCAASV